MIVVFKAVLQHLPFTFSYYPYLLRRYPAFTSRIKRIYSAYIPCFIPICLNLQTLHEGEEFAENHDLPSSIIMYIYFLSTVIYE